MFDSVFATDIISSTVLSTAAASVISLLCGIIFAAVYRFGNSSCTRSMTLAIAILPITVQAVIMLVNGNVGTGVAVMGAFSLVRFRSLPGSSRDICLLFSAMAVGIATGMGYIWFALMFAIVLGVVILIAEKCMPSNDMRKKQLKVTIPEDLDYCGIFNDIFAKYTNSSSLIRVKTTNMGTMYELVYHITEKNGANEKEMLDAIRCRNGNLTIVCGMIPTENTEL